MTLSHDKRSEALLFIAILLLYVTLNANQRTKKKRGGARNEAKHLVALQHMCRGLVAKNDSWGGAATSYSTGS